MATSFNPNFNCYIVVSTEDHIKLVKGGIGTYLGLLHQSFKKYLPQVLLIWITESPDSSFYVKKNISSRIFYLPRTGKGIKYKIERACMRIHRLLTLKKENQIVIEAPDWEGLLSNFFYNDLGKNTLRITRLHSVLALTKQQMKKFSIKEEEQIQNEYKQILNSDIISAPTMYVYDYTARLLGKEFSNIPHFIIPNFINIKFYKAHSIDREKCCANFNNILKKNIIFSENKNVFCIGSLEFRKGIDLVLKIADALIKKDKNIHFYLIGHFSQNNQLTLNTKYTKNYLESIISKCIINNIHICGYIPYERLRYLYNACDTFLFCYRHDNFPGSLIEACLSKKNIVFLKRGGCREIMNYKTQDLGIGFDGNNNNEIIENGIIAMSKSLQKLDLYSATSIKNKYRTDNIIKMMCYDYKLKQ